MDSIDIKITETIEPMPVKIAGIQFINEYGNAVHQKIFTSPVVLHRGDSIDLRYELKID